MISAAAKFHGVEARSAETVDLGCPATSWSKPAMIAADTAQYAPASPTGSTQPSIHVVEQH